MSWPYTLGRDCRMATHDLCLRLDHAGLGTGEKRRTKPNGSCQSYAVNVTFFREAVAGEEFKAYCIATWLGGRSRQVHDYEARREQERN